MKAACLFEGIGGFGLALERADFDIAWQCEIDPKCREVLATHFPDVPCYTDVKNIHGGDANGSLPAVDVLCGGFP